MRTLGSCTLLAALLLIAGLESAAQDKKKDGEKGKSGTVIGILNAFNSIAEQGNATLATVAAPVGNALFATAAGLFAAIPAVVAYNSFVSRIKVFDTEMANFSADFLNIIKRHFFR